MTGNRLFIGNLAKQAGVNPKTIRYYETLGLLPQPQRGENRYRLYSKETVELLNFIVKAKALEFTLAEIKEIVGIHQRGRQPCAHVRTLVEQKVADLDQMLTDLITLRRRLERLLVDWKEREKRQGPEAAVCPHIEGEPFRRAPQRERRSKHR